MSITDLSGNALPNGTMGQMLGFVEPPSPEEVLTLRIYRFLIDQIRIEDAKPEGALFVKRFLEGPQQVWSDIQDKIFGIKDLWDVSKIKDEHLQYLKNIVGWTSDLSSITDRLDADKLRKLISTSIPLWKQRGTDDAMQNVITLVTGARTRVWDWFDFRWVLDETEMGEEHEGRDPWIIDLPGVASDEYRSNLRVVDDGSLDHTLVVELVKLMRASGERWEVSFIDFLDRFGIDGDDTQWFESGLDVPLVASGLAQLSDNTSSEMAVVSLARALDWSHYALYARLRATSSVAGNTFGVVFYWTDSTNYYFASLDVANNTVTLKKNVGGSISTIASSTFYPGTLTSDVYYGIRVQATDEGATNRIKVYVDNDEIINTTDADLSGGSIGFFHDAGVDDTELDEIELSQIPLTTTTVDINP